MTFSILAEVPVNTLPIISNIRIIGLDGENRTAMKNRRIIFIKGGFVL